MLFEFSTCTREEYTQCIIVKIKREKEGKKNQFVMVIHDQLLENESRVIRRTCRVIPSLTPLVTFIENVSLLCSGSGSSIQRETKREKERERDLFNSILEEIRSRPKRGLSICFFHFRLLIVPNKFFFFLAKFFIFKDF